MADTTQANYNSHGKALDGKSKIEPTPFGQHERNTHGEHVETKKDSPDLDPKKVNQYPKAVAHEKHPSGVGHEPVVVKSAAEEREYKRAQTEKEKAAAEAESAKA